MGRADQVEDVSGSVGHARRKVDGRSTVRCAYRITLAAVAIFGLAACHGSGATSAASAPGTDTDAPTVTLPTYYNAPLQTGTASPTDIDPASTAGGSSSASDSTATSVGQLTVSTTGSNVVTTLSVAPAGPSPVVQPPAEAMDACNWNYAPVLAQSVFIHATVTIQYNGKLPEGVSFAPSLRDLKTGFTQVGFYDHVFSTSDGSWGECGGAFGATLQPGQSVTTELWIDDKLLSNSHPTFSPPDVQGLALQVGAVDADQAGLGIGNTTSASGGPGAAACNTDDPGQATLLLYSTPPFSYATQNETGTQLSVTCTAP